VSDAREGWRIGPLEGILDFEFWILNGRGATRMDRDHPIPILNDSVLNDSVTKFFRT
jgi:hypothetical protein